MRRKVSSNSVMMRYCALAAALCLGKLLAAPLNAAADLPRQLEEIRERHGIAVVATALAAGNAPVVPLILGADADTPLRWGSITKTITAMTVLTLAEQGKVSLQAPLQRYVDASHWGNPWRDSHPVRVIDLLEMRAGLPDLSAREFAYNQPLTLTQALALDPQHRYSRWPPGSQHVYSNMTAGLTQLLIETVSKEPYGAAAAQYALEPLGMSHAGFTPAAGLPGGFKADGVTEIPYWHMTFPAYGALNAPLRDMMKLLHALLRPGQLPPLAQQHLFAPHGRRWGQQFTFDYAAGLYPRVRRGHVWHTHGGDADGYRSRLAVLADGSGGYLANINSDNPAALREIEALLEAALTADRTPPATLPTTTLSDVDRVAIAGRYYPSSTRFALPQWERGRLHPILVEVAAEQLTITRRGSRTVLYPVGPTLFRRHGDPVATVTIFSHDGQTYMQGELGNYKRVSAGNETDQ